MTFAICSDWMKATADMAATKFSAVRSTRFLFESSVLDLIKSAASGALNFDNKQHLSMVRMDDICARAKTMGSYFGAQILFAIQGGQRIEPRFPIKVPDKMFFELTKLVILICNKIL